MMVRRGFILSTPLLSSITWLCAATIYALLSANFIEQKVGLALLTILLMLFILAEINVVRIKQPTRWLLNPAIFCSATTFALYFGITNIIYYMPGYAINKVGLPAEISLSMNKLMFLVITGAVAMWLGYWSPVASRILRGNFITNLQYKYFNNDSEPKFWVIPLLYFLANVGRLLEVWFGIYGYSGNYQRALETASYNQFLTTLDNAGILALLIITLQYYHDNSSWRIRIYFYFILFGELIWGLLSGMKSAIMLPFIAVLIIQYIRGGRMSKTWLLLVPIIIFTSYTLVDPFRNERNNNPNFEATSVSGIVTAIVDAQKRQFEQKHSLAIKESDEQENIIAQEADAAVLIKFMRRTNLTYDGSIGVEFADDNSELPPGSPHFLLNTLQAPIAAFIPRLIWNDKPLQNIGVWYTQVVMGQPYSFSSTAMSLFTNLYFIGGFIAVFIGMFLIGVTQRVVFFTTKPWISAAGAIVYLGLMTKFEIIAESDTQTIIGFTARMLPIMLIFQALAYKHKSKYFKKGSHNA